ncbi:MAG TPA: hypothetical protein VJ372_13785 [Pyrinomonadaceae bacterium]|jgi:hypothetical protein|nr:hypothetical protein [Pyrinomonadaceae bacterium]
MEEAARAPLVAWENFYVIVGSSGAALTGLQFVVMALVANTPKARSSTREIDAFGTPTIVHFCAVLLISAIMSAPWQGLSWVRLVLGTCAIVGVIYGIIVLRRAGAQMNYKPVWEDWLWHAVLPLIAYTLLLLSSVLIRSYTQRTLFVIATVALLLLFVGIHNAWDTVTYIALVLPQSSSATKSSPESVQSEPD